MNQIDLPFSCITAPTRYDVDLLAAAMLWPQDEDLRSRAQGTALALEVKRRLAEGEALPAATVRELIGLALGASAPKDLQFISSTPYVHGFIVGHVVHNAIAYAEIDPGRSAINSTVDHLFKVLWPVFRVKPQTIRNTVLPAFRPVAHFWAAYVGRMWHGYWSNCFPCAPADLPDFLAWSQSYLLSGEEIRLRHAPSTVLKPGISLKLPEDVLAQLPKDRLRFRAVGQQG